MYGYQHGTVGQGGACCVFTEVTKPQGSLLLASCAVPLRLSISTFYWGRTFHWGHDHCFVILDVYIVSHMMNQGGLQTAL